MLISPYFIALVAAGQVPASRCDFEVVDGPELLQGTFGGESWTSPLLIRNAFSERKGASTKKGFAAAFEGVGLFGEGLSSSFQRFGTLTRKNRTTFDAWVGQMDADEGVRFTVYWCHHNAECLRRMSATYDIPAFARRLAKKILLTIGKERGVALHTHDAAWVALQSGIKTWFVAPPSTRQELLLAPYVHHSEEEMEMAYAKASREQAKTGNEPQLLHCDQRAGELLYLPDSWWHATYNKGPWTLGIGGQGLTASAGFFEALTGNKSFLQAALVGMKKTKAAAVVRADELLHAAALGGQVAVARFLVSTRTDVRASSKTSGLQPIHYASESGHADIVALLLEKGSKVDALGIVGNGVRPLMKAAQEGHVDVVKLLVDSGASVGASDENGDQAIHCAADGGHEAIVTFLLDSGANRDAAGERGWQPIHKALRMGHEGVMNILLERGVGVDRADERGNRLIYVAAHVGHEGLVKRLLDSGASVDAVGMNGDEPIHNAAMYGHSGVAKILLDSGASVDAVDSEGNQPIHVAVRHGHEGLVKLLLASGASADAVGAQGMRPINIAHRYIAISPTTAAQQLKGIVKRLLKSGARPANEL